MRSSITGYARMKGGCTISKKHGILQRMLHAESKREIARRHLDRILSSPGFARNRRSAANQTLALMARASNRFPLSTHAMAGEAQNTTFLFVPTGSTAFKNARLPEEAGTSCSSLLAAASRPKPGGPSVRNVFAASMF